MASLSRVRPVGAPRARLLARRLSDVHANAQRNDTGAKIDRDDLVGSGDNTDWFRNEALHIGLNRTTVNGDVPKAEDSVVVRNFGSRRSIDHTSQDHASAIASPRASISDG